MGLFSRRVKVGPLPPQANPYPSRLRRIRRPSALVFACLFILGYYVITWVSPTLHMTVKETFINYAYRVSRYVSHPFYVAKSYVTDHDSFLSLATENKQLSRENENLKTALLNHAQLLIQNRELKKYAALSEILPQTSKTFPVLSLPSDGLHDSCIIQGGTAEGIKTNSVAITPDGVVGRIDQMTPHAARVLLITNYQSKTPVFIPRLSQNAIAVGDGSETPLLTYLEKSDEIQEGDEVFTSGLGGIYPRGLYVGKVIKRNADEIRIHLAVNMRNLSYLRIFENSVNLEDEIRKLDEDES